MAYIITVSNGISTETSGTSYTFTWTGPDTAQASVGVRARDNVSNTSAPAIVTFGVNLTPPASQASAPPTANGVITVTWIATSALGIASVELWALPPGGAWASAGPTQTGASGAFVYQPTAQGTYSFATRSRDVADSWEWSGAPPANRVVSTAYSAPPQVKRVTKYYALAGKRVAMRADNVVYYLHGDHLGSTSLVTCGSSLGCDGKLNGQVVSRQWYDPYGSLRGQVGASPTDVGYTAQKNVASINLLFYRARFYSSSLGRFLSADTIVPRPGNPADLNRYAYTRNNPLNYVDPSGHGPISEWLISVGRSGPVGKALDFIGNKRYRV